MRLLCVDDEDVLRRTLERLLRVLGHEVVGVHTAEAALEALERERFDVILTDLRLPGMDGVALCERVSQRWPELGERCVLMSGFGAEQADTGGLVFLQKPFTAAALRAVLEQITSS